MEKRQKDKFQSNQLNEDAVTAMQPQEVFVPAEDVSDLQTLPQTGEANGLSAIDEATEHQTQADAEVEGTLLSGIEEVDSALADLLSVGDFITGNRANNPRQANAILSVINHENSKRSKVEKSVLQKLHVQVDDLVNATVNNGQVILMKSRDDSGIPVKKGSCLYNSQLVDAITNEFAFDFTNQSTHHLLNVTYKTWNGQMVAIITE